MSYNLLLKFAALKRQVGLFVSAGLIGCLPQTCTVLKPRSILILSLLLFSVYSFVPMPSWPICLSFVTFTRGGHVPIHYLIG